MYKKVFVDVIAYFDTQGDIEPLEIIWEDGTRYKIDRVIKKEKAASLKAGGAGIRYIIKIRGQERHLFLEESRWFVEVWQEPEVWE